MMIKTDKIAKNKQKLATIFISICWLIVDTILMKKYDSICNI
jgi:hypothetical protein